MLLTVSTIPCIIGGVSFWYFNNLFIALIAFLSVGGFEVMWLFFNHRSNKTALNKIGKESNDKLKKNNAVF